REAIPDLQDQWWFGISPEGFGSVAMGVNFAVALLVNLFSPEPPEEVQQMVENIRLPGGAPPAQPH
ncbi:MAG: cation acetate symporter, partial [Robiginitalea sp.]